jgi:hypothetical protein
MSLSSRLAIATMGYRGGFSGEGTGQNFYIVEEVSLEMPASMEFAVSSIQSAVSVSVDSLLSIAVSYEPTDVSLTVLGVD